MLAAYDARIREGKEKIYPWQVKIHKKWSEVSPSGQMNDIDVVAANGSGKSKMIVAPAALYIACQYDKAEIVITTASGQQLDRQSARHLRDFATQINKIHSGAFEIQHRRLTFKPTDGIIDLFATDEPGQAEGWHQRDYDSAFAIIVDEAKSLNEEIYTALDRCHDSQWYLKVSSPGKTSGTFFRSCTSGNSSFYRISAYDCPHISSSRIERIINRYGRYSPKTRSIIDALFSSEDEQIVITKEALDAMYKNPPLLNEKGFPLRVGGDLAAGGDENVISVWRGNKQLGMEYFVEKNAINTVAKIEFILNKYGVQKDNEHMFFDDGGVGRPIIDFIRNRGWNIKRVLNQSKALGGDLTSGNRGAELWFKFSTYIVSGELIMMDDSMLREQLSNRFYRQQSVSGKNILESKREAKAKGHPSPDRADATVLAFTDVPIGPYFSLLGDEKAVPKDKPLITQQDLVEMMDRFKFREFDREVREKVTMEINGSQSMLVHPDYITPEEIMERYGWNNAENN